jgi:ribosomal protein S6
MDKVLKEDTIQVYEIGYLLVSSIPEEKVTSEVAILKEVLSKKGAEFIGEEVPELRTLAYTMIKKIGTANIRFTQGYFGWFKFELAKKDIESIKKAIDENKNVLRSLIITTIRDNTYLGKKAAVASIIKLIEINEVAGEIVAGVASPEELDKSIDEMVKEA